MKHTPDKFRDNAYLCALDMSHATDEQQIAWLNLIIDNELARGDQKDEQLIYECAEHLALLSPDIAMSEEECRAHLQALLASVPTKKARILTLPDRHVRRKFALRFAALASALIMIVALSPQVYAYAVLQQDNRQYESIIQKEVEEIETSYLASLPTDASSEKPYQAAYESLTAFFDRHSQLSFYYPHQLPRAQAIRSIRITYCSEENWLVIFTFHDPSIRHFTVQCLPQTVEPPEASEDALRFAVDGREYVTTQKDGLFKAVCADGSLRYTLTADDYDTACEILSLTKSRAYRYADMEALRRDWEHLQEFAWPTQLPAGFSIGNATLTYDTHTSWQIVVQLKYHDGELTTANHSLTLTPTADHDFGNDKPRLSNEKTDIYIPYSSQSETAGLCQAECLVGNIKYDTKIFGYDPFMAFLNGFFGPF